MLFMLFELLETIKQNKLFIPVYYYCLVRLTMKSDDGGKTPAYSIRPSTP